MIETLFISLFSDSLVLSWLISVGVTAILLAPTLLVLFLPRRFRFKYTVAGAAFGALAIPLSFWLYIHFFVGALRALLFGLPGLLMLGVHLSVFRNPSVASHEMVVHPINGFIAGLSSTPFQEVLFWMVFYATLGAGVDGYRTFSARKSARVGKSPNRT